MTNPKPSMRQIASAAMLLITGVFARAEDTSDIVYQPLKFGGLQEFGGITHGVVANDAGVVASRNPQLRGEWVDHFGTFLEQDALVNRRLELRLGMGGIFEFPKPEHPIPKYGSSMFKMFFFGPAVAKAMYGFGDPEHPVFSLGGGIFPFKYNPDAADLGEYLFRSGPYPSYIMTGGLTFINDNSAYLQGFHANLHLGNLSLDGMLTTENSMPPLYDWSAALVANYRLMDGVVELGAGVNFKRLIPVNDKRTQHKVLANAYFSKYGTEYFGDSSYYVNNRNFYAQYVDVAQTVIRDSAQAANYQRILDSLYVWLPDSANLGLNYYTPAGAVVMARLSVNLGKLLGLDGEKNPCKLFAEAAVLGWKDYPVFYEDKWKRAPVMVGAHVPTFGVLDQLTVQFEYFNSPWSNSTYNLGAKNLGLPTYPDGNEALFSKSVYNDITKHDNISWAVLLSRHIYSHLNLNAQFARDHMRTIGTNWFYGGRFEPSEVLYRNSYWYWMVQLGWGI